jgi:endonuclease/exonuclease/phosphatase family metal-dependent hydrolase
MRVISYNIHKGIGGRDRRYRLERIIDVLSHEQPDIVCLQEVDRHVRRSRFDDQPHILAERLELPHALYQPNVPLIHGWYGNLILSRWPLVERHQLSLRLKTKKPRGAQLALVDSPEGRFLLGHFHLGLGEAERIWQMRHLLTNHLYRKLSHWPTLLIGDTNDWRNQLLKCTLEQFQLIQVTAPISRFRTFPAWLPLGSLDKAYLGGPWRVQNAHVGQSKLARAASDHLPLILELSLEPA